MPDAPPRPEPFTPRAAPAALEDLRARLGATRWPDAPEDAGWSLGTDLAYLRELVAYWADGFDWPAQEAALARFPRFRVPLGGLGIHFVHARAAAPAGPVLRLVLCHGWPDSSWRYAKVIPLLVDPGAHGADPADAFDVVVPDMPGYGYSAPRRAAPRRHRRGLPVGRAHAAGTSRRSRSPSSTRRNCPRSSAPTGRRRRAEGAAACGRGRDRHVGVSGWRVDFLSRCPLISVRFGRAGPPGS